MLRGRSTGDLEQARCRADRPIATGSATRRPRPWCSTYPSPRSRAPNFADPHSPAALGPSHGCGPHPPAAIALDGLSTAIDPASGRWPCRFEWLGWKWPNRPIATVAPAQSRRPHWCAEQFRPGAADRLNCPIAPKVSGAKIRPAGRSARPAPPNRSGRPVGPRDRPPRPGPRAAGEPPPAAAPASGCRPFLRQFVPSCRPKPANDPVRSR